MSASVANPAATAPQAIGGRVTDAVDSLSLLKKGVWLYFLLLIFEGALRKWVLPGLATPLLIVRDPIAIWLIAMTWKRGLLPGNAYLSGMTLLGITSIFTAVFVGHGNLTVAIYGARILLLHFPLIFVIGAVFDRRDVLKVARFTLWLAIPMTLLIVLQFYSPQSAWVNRGIGGDAEGAGFSGAMGYFRPPGTFSFITGTVQFYSLVAAFLFYFWLSPKGENKLMLLGASASLLIALPCSISRTLLFQVALTVVFVAIAILRNPKYIGKMVGVGVGLLIILIGLSSTTFFLTAQEAFLSRFDTASGQEGGLKGTLGDRFLGGLITALTSSTELPFFGHGSGMGTNAGSMLMSGQRKFLIAEEEWGRVVGELGMLMGLAVIGIRLGLGLKMTLAGFRQAAAGDFMAWFLVSYEFLSLVQGQWAQPNILGFSVFVGGLLVASLRRPTGKPTPSLSNVG